MLKVVLVVPAEEKNLIQAGLHPPLSRETSVEPVVHSD